MAAFKLKSNILELVCRTCLKINKVRFNIFEYLQNNKVVSTMLMDCLPMKVCEDDGFPVNICSNCLEKLTSAYDFKTMAMQSEAKLHNFYQNKILESEKDSQDNVGSVYIKEEGTALKLEQIDHPFDLSEHMNYEDLTQDSLIEEQNTNINNIKHNTSTPTISMQQCKQAASLVSNNNEISDATLISSYCKNEYIDQPEEVHLNNFIEEHASSTSTKLETSKISNPIIDDDDDNMLNEDEVPNQLSGSSDDSDHSSTCSHSSDESENKTENTGADSKATKKRKKNKRGNQVNCNEQQAELLNNPDYKRIISSGLSKKEKDRATVFCKECGKTLKFRYFVSVHAYTHTGAPAFKCGKCDKCFPRDYILKQHMRIHSETKDFSCDVCGKSFTTLLSAQLHKTKHSEERPHACNVCGKSFKYTAALRHHLKIHNDDKNFVCELCGKSFLNNGGLARHKETHNTEKNFVCTTCGKSFKSQTNLNDHVKRHSDDKRYACTYCDKRFKGHEVLKNHILIHTGEKPFTCSVCDKKFRQRPSLRYHMRTHTGETPYDCEFCPSKFRYKHHLLNHMKVHRNEVSEKQNISSECSPPPT